MSFTTILKDHVETAIKEQVDCIKRELYEKYEKELHNRMNQIADNVALTILKNYSIKDDMNCIKITVDKKKIEKK